MRKKTPFVIDGARLTALRLEFGWSLLEMAEKIKLNKGNLSKWERGVVAPSDASIIRLAILFNRGDFIREIEVGGGKRGKRARARRKAKPVSASA